MHAEVGADGNISINVEDLPPVWIELFKRAKISKKELSDSQLLTKLMNLVADSLSAKVMINSCIGDKLIKEASSGNIAVPSSDPPNDPNHGTFYSTPLPNMAPFTQSYPQQLPPTYPQQPYAQPGYPAQSGYRQSYPYQQPYTQPGYPAQPYTYPPAGYPQQPVIQTLMQPMPIQPQNPTSWVSYNPTTPQPQSPVLGVVPPPFVPEVQQPPPVVVQQAPPLEAQQILQPVITPAPLQPPAVAPPPVLPPAVPPPPVLPPAVPPPPVLPAHTNTPLKHSTQAPALVKTTSILDEIKNKPTLKPVNLTNLTVADKNELTDILKNAIERHRLSSREDINDGNSKEDDDWDDWDD